MIKLLSMPDNDLINLLIAIVSVLFALFTLASFIKWNNWWIRIFDYPRLQISSVLLVLMIFSFIYFSFSETWHYLIAGVQGISLFYQARKIYRFTYLVKNQVPTHKGDYNEHSISLMVSNVLQDNRNSHKVLELVNKLQPHLLLLLETDKWWEDQMKPIEKDYPFTLRKPQDNLYGMNLYSRFELIDPEIKYLIEDDIPSFESVIRIDSNDLIKIYCLHPRPPFPTESDTTKNRDAELLIVGKKVKNEQLPVLIFGDFNDVAWSNTTSLFQKISSMLDPRIGRGFYNTFHANHPLMRWSLDHIFHSSHFKLIRISRLPKIGSDHFPIFVHLYLDVTAPEVQEEPNATTGEEQEATEKIQEAEPRLKTISNK
jgi:endonuclease/exonuclease/phosphatase (EEP) superfamily protein YafD